MSHIPRGVPAYTMFGGSSEPGPSISISIEKVGNGYTLGLQTFPPPPKRRPPSTSPFAGMETGEVVDRVIDSIGMLSRAINNKGAGEDWKGDEEREKLREGFRALFPGVYNQIEQAVEPPEIQVQPRAESLVFESKIALLEFLTKEL